MAAFSPLEFSWRALISPPFLLIFLRVLCTAKTILAVYKGYMGGVICVICPRRVAAWAPSLLHFLIATYRQTFCGVALASSGSTTVNFLFYLFNGHQSSVFTSTLFYAHFSLHAKKSTLAPMAGYWLSPVRPKLGRDCRSDRRDFGKEVGAPALSWTSLRSYHSLIGRHSS